ncbi:MAG: hypothetical protein IT379_29345 [Deltaproteobacteria bacterium]|jgi:hypothetical protein|nr:hypothetical protein [Deltaproteobacteria bacterium]
MTQATEQETRVALIDALRARLAVLRTLTLPYAYHERAQIVAHGAEYAAGRSLAELQALHRSAGLLLEVGMQPGHCYRGGSFDDAAKVGGCHAGEDADRAWCECECVTCQEEV